MLSLLQAAAVARGKGEYPERMGQPECQVYKHIGMSVLYEWSDLVSRVLSQTFGTVITVNYAPVVDGAHLNLLVVQLVSMVQSLEQL